MVIANTHKNQRSIDIAKNHIKEANGDIIIHLGDCIEDVELLKEKFNSWRFIMVLNMALII